MDALLRKLAALQARHENRDRVRERRTSKAVLGPDTLEDRKLLSTATATSTGTDPSQRTPPAWVSDSGGLGLPDPGRAGPKARAEMRADGQPAKDFADFARNHKDGWPGGAPADAWGKGLGGHKTGKSPPTLTAQAKSDLQTLQTDMKAIQAKSTVTAAQEQAVRSDLDAIHAARTKPPSADARAALQTDLKATNGVPPTGGVGTQIQTDVTNLLESEGVDSSLITKLLADQQTVIKAQNITPQDQAKITADQKVVATDLGLPSMPGPNPGGPGGDFLQGPLLSLVGGPKGMMNGPRRF